MNGVSFLLLLVLMAIVGAAMASSLRRARKGGGCCGERETAVRIRKEGGREYRSYPYRVTMEIGGMTCQNCARRVQNALNGVDGVLAHVRIDSKQADIRLKRAPDETELKKLREAVRAAGYAVLKTI